MVGEYESRCYYHLHHDEKEINGNNKEKTSHLLDSHINKIGRFTLLLLRCGNKGRKSSRATYAISCSF